MENKQGAHIIVHDIRGQICPSSLLFTLREINREQDALKEDRTRLIIWTDNRDAIATIPETVSRMGYASRVEKKEGYYQIEISANRKVVD